MWRYAEFGPKEQAECDDLPRLPVCRNKAGVLNARLRKLILHGSMLRKAPLWSVGIITGMRLYSHGAENHCRDGQRQRQKETRSDCSYNG